MPRPPDERRQGSLLHLVPRERQATGFRHSHLRVSRGGRRRRAGQARRGDSAHERRHRAGLSAQARAPAHRRGQELEGVGRRRRKRIRRTRRTRRRRRRRERIDRLRRQGIRRRRRQHRLPRQQERRRVVREPRRARLPGFARSFRCAVGRDGRWRRGRVHAPRRRRPQPRRRPRAGPEHVQPVRRGRRQGVQDGAGGEAAARHRRGGEAPSRPRRGYRAQPRVRSAQERVREGGRGGHGPHPLRRGARHEVGHPRHDQVRLRREPAGPEESDGAALGGG
mmetsp:Transcript_14248/g.60252  ORF Transcript_14248/g.60252 Transcript_14248/m.60252 type:complete len:280 (-) Transcript_14248:1119-1958(-)